MSSICIVLMVGSVVVVWLSWRHEMEERREEILTEYRRLAEDFDRLFEELYREEE